MEYNKPGDFMTIDKETVSLIQFDLDNDKSEYELKAIKLTMEGNKEESKYFSLIVDIYKDVSNYLDKTFNKEYDKFLASFNSLIKDVRNTLIETMHNLDNPSDGFVAGYKIMYLDDVYHEVLNKLAHYA